MNPGRLIALEGLDGCGKSTQAARLAAALRARGLDVLETREPTDGATGRRIRAMARSGEKRTPEQELRWFWRDRREHVDLVIEPALAAGRWVVTDRYYLSTVAYQGARGLDWRDILARSEAEFPRPDVALLFELPVEEGLDRARSRGGAPEPVFEESEHLRRAAAIFASLELPYLVRVDARGEADAVARRTLGALEAALAPTPGGPMSDELDPDALKAFSKRVFGALQGAMTSAMICLGDRLGLYRALAGGGPASSEELARRTGLAERWVREWLYQQGAAGVLESDGEERFQMTPEARAVLADESHPAFGCGMFSSLPDTIALVEKLPEAFRSGVGFDYDALGPGGAAGIERGFAPWFRALLVPLALPRIEGLVRRLEAGVRVADVGCGAGVALIEMAKAFPASEFHGYEISRHALERAEKNRAREGLDNVRFHDARREPLPADGSFQFATSFDCLHDMTDPAAVIASIRAALADDGVWLIADIKAKDGFAANVEENPMAALMYGTSVLTCLSSALSEPGGAGLGTLGLHEALARQLCAEAGFTRFEPLDLGHPVNAFYVVRP